MGAFIGTNEIGIWVSNGMRDDFLDWFAEHRCVEHDPRWDFCKSEGNRWPGANVELSDLLPSGHATALNLTTNEIEQAKAEYPWRLDQLLIVVDQILRGEWLHHAGSDEAMNWKKAEQPARGD
jgi:hypothetical protein